MSNTCGMTLYAGNGVEIPCGKPATWKHPRWPGAGYCTEHADTLKKFFPHNWKEIKTEIEFIRCQVLFPHVRDIGGQTMMLEPMLSGNVVLPNDEDTKKCVERGWLKTVSEPFMAEPSYDPTK